MVFLYPRHDSLSIHDLFTPNGNFKPLNLKSKNIIKTTDCGLHELLRERFVYVTFATANPDVLGDGNETFFKYGYDGLDIDSSIKKYIDMVVLHDSFGMVLSSNPSASHIESIEQLNELISSMLYDLKTRSWGVSADIYRKCTDDNAYVLFEQKQGLYEGVHELEALNDALYDWAGWRYGSKGSVDYCLLASKNLNLFSLANIEQKQLNASKGFCLYSADSYGTEYIVKITDSVLFNGYATRIESTASGQESQRMQPYS